MITSPALGSPLPSSVKTAVLTTSTPVWIFKRVMVLSLTKLPSVSIPSSLTSLTSNPPEGFDLANTVT